MLLQAALDFQFRSHPWAIRLYREAVDRDPLELTAYRGLLEAATRTGDGEEVRRAQEVLGRGRYPHERTALREVRSPQGSETSVANSPHVTAQPGTADGNPRGLPRPRMGFRL